MEYLNLNRYQEPFQVSQLLVQKLHRSTVAVGFLFDGCYGT